MSHQFYPLRVKNINRETSDCVSISFDIDAALKNTFSYKAGQYINLKANINGEEVRRSYSICSAPSENELRVAIKKVDGGRFSTFANEKLAEGDTLDVMPPNGNFCLPENLDDCKRIVFYCAGSGITPAMSLIKTILYHHPTLSVMLYYGNRNTESIIFREELEGLKNLYLDRFVLQYILSKEMLSTPLFYGRIDKEKCSKFEKVLNPQKEESLYYLCGPATMIFDVKEALIDSRVAENKIHFELFNTDGITTSKEKREEASKQSGNKVKVKLDDLIFDFTYDSKYNNLLDAALANGADLPFACKGGVCSTCKAKCESGSVEMYVNYALEPDELTAGFVLTCQSFPTSDDVYINFDA